MSPPIAYFGIESKSLSLVIDLLILFVVVLYFSLLYWTYADARRRIADPMLVGCATVASLFPFVGTIVYMILRPPEYLEDVRERELELQAAEARLHELDYSLCPHCDYRIERDFIRCPSCLRKLKERCVSCSRPLDRAWTICPYCETDVPATAKATRRAARSERASASATARTRAGAEGELEVAALDVEAVSPARARAAKRAAVRAPEPAPLSARSRLPRSRALPLRIPRPGARTPSLKPLSSRARVRAHIVRARLPERPEHSSQTSRPRAATISYEPKEHMDRTLILVKPDAFARSLTGEIIARFERKGLRIVALRHMTVTRELAERHYAEHAEKPFFGELVQFITSGPIVAMVLEGLDAVKAARQTIGATNPLDAAPGSIRGDFAIEMGQNMVHGSDSAESAAREAALFFPEL